MTRHEPRRARSSRQTDSGAQRVRITSSRRPSRAPARRPLQADLDEQTELGEVYLRGLMRAQFTLAASIIGMGVVGLGGLPLLFFLVPATGQARVFSVPISWLLIAVLVYPATFLIAAHYVRRATRIEADFTELVRRRS
ncbi:MAG TPA: hypothetical protein GXZ60_12460 [Intrasporangiaceae bacterium]|nr:hypothetical protein [Intrasporangiaceae bacterium]